MFGFDYWTNTLLTFVKLTLLVEWKHAAVFLGVWLALHWCYPAIRTCSRALQTGFRGRVTTNSFHSIFQIGQSLWVKSSGGNRGVIDPLFKQKDLGLCFFWGGGGIRCTFPKTVWPTWNWRFSVRLQQLDSEDWSCCMQLRFPRMSSEGSIWTSTDPCS